MRSSYRFCGLMLAFAICGCDLTKKDPLPPPSPPPPPSHQLTLDVQSGSSTGHPGYTDTTGSNGQTYRYMYTGGNPDQNSGDVMVSSGEGPNVPIVLHLTGSYRIGDIGFQNDTNHQLSKEPIVNPRNAVMRDLNTGLLDGKYKVTVNDGSVTIPCDPRIVNN